MDVVVSAVPDAVSIGLNGVPWLHGPLAVIGGGAAIFGVLHVIKWVWDLLPIA